MSLIIESADDPFTDHPNLETPEIAACAAAALTPCEPEALPVVVAIDEDEDEDLEELGAEELPAAIDPIDDFEEDDFDDDFDDDFEEELEEEEDLDEEVTEADLHAGDDASPDDVGLDDE